MGMLVCLTLSQRSLKLSSFLFFLFALFYSAAVISTILSSSSLIHFSAPFILLLSPSSVFFISVILFVQLCLFFNSFSSLLNISCILLVCASVLFPRSWIIFMIITLNSFAGRWPIFTQLLFWGFILFLHLEHTPVLSFCLIFCVCIPTGCRIVVPLASGICPLVGEAGPRGCLGFLVEGTGACLLVDEAGSCLSGGQDHVQWCVLGCL